MLQTPLSEEVRAPKRAGSALYPFCGLGVLTGSFVALLIFFSRQNSADFAQFQPVMELVSSDDPCDDQTCGACKRKVDSCSSNDLMAHVNC